MASQPAPVSSVSQQVRKTADLACESAVKLLGASHSSFMMLAPDGRSGRLISEYPSSIGAVGTIIPIADVPMEERLVASKEIIEIDDVDSQPNFEPVASILRSFGIRSLLIVPVVVDGRMIGSFSVDSIGRRRILTFEEKDLCSTFAMQVQMAFENALLFEIAARRRDLITALDDQVESLTAEKEPDKLLKEVVRLALELIGGSAAGILKIHNRTLELKHAIGLDQTPVGTRLGLEDGLFAAVVKDGLPRLVSDFHGHPDEVFAFYEFRSMAAVPLKHLGKVEHVLFVADRSSQPRFIEADLDVLSRLATRAASAWNASVLVSPETRRMHHLAMLHHSLNFLRTTTDLDRVYHIILTTITAGWGLRFNRAALFLIDNWRHVIYEAMAIGQITGDQARQSWSESKRAGLNDPLRYLTKTRQDLFPPTPLHLALRDFQMPMPHQFNDEFFGALGSSEPHILPLQALPEVLRDCWHGGSDVTVAPMIAGGSVMGFVLADNRFTNEQVTEQDLDILKSFCEASSSAIQNLRRDDENRIAQERLRDLLIRSEALLSPTENRESLARILEHTVAAAHSDGASLIVANDERYLQQIMTWPRQDFDCYQCLEHNSLTAEVSVTGQARALEDLNERRDELDPASLGSKHEAAACFPIKSDQNPRGVLWLLYKEARRWQPEELEDLQVYLNLASVMYDGAQRQKDMESLLAAAREISGSSLDDVLDSILSVACKITDGQAATIWPYDERERKFITRRAKSKGIPLNELHPPTTDPNGGILGTSYESSETHRRFASPANSNREILWGFGFLSYQGVLLKVGNDTVGVLYIAYREDRNFSARDRNRLENYAVFAALSLKRAELWQQLGRAKRSIESIANVAVQGDLRQSLASIAASAREASGCDAVTLYDYDSESQQMRNPPVMNNVWFPERVFSYDQEVLSELLIEIFKKDEPSVNLPALELTRFAKEEKVRTCVALPLTFGGQKVGLLFLNYRQPAGSTFPHEISSEDLELLKLLAKQSAATMHHAKLIEQRTDELARTERERKGLAALHEAARAIAGKGGEQVLDLIVEHAVLCVSEAETQQKVQGVMMIVDNGALEVRTAHDSTPGAPLQKVIGHRLPLNASRHPWGITCRAAIEGKPQRVDNVLTDPDYICLNEATRSELAVPFLSGQKLIGVLDVQANDIAFFDERDEQILTALAELAVISIQTDLLRKNAEEVDKRMLQALGKCCHDLITPLDTVGLILQNLKGAIGGELNASQIRDADAGWREIRRMGDLAWHVLDVVKVQLGKEQLPLDYCKVARLFEELVSDHDHRAREKLLTLESRVIPEDLQARLHLLTTSRALSIILQNAFRHSPNGGKITLSAERHNNKVILAVTDEGDGIDKLHLEKIFEPGFTTAGSTGLGLWFARELVLLLNGTISVESEAGKGATFKISLPIIDEKEHYAGQGENPGGG